MDGSLDDFFRDAVNDCQSAWRDVISKSVELGIPTPAFSTALAFYDGYRSAKLPANLIQVYYVPFFKIDVPKLCFRVRLPTFEKFIIFCTPCNCILQVIQNLHHKLLYKVWINSTWTC